MNTIPDAYDAVIQLLEDAADGAQTHGAALGLTHNNEAKLRLDLTTLVGVPAGPNNTPPAVPGRKSLWNTAQATKSAKTAALRTTQSNNRFLARTCIRSLMPILGEEWNAQWKTAGIEGGSLAVPAGSNRNLAQQTRQPPRRAVQPRRRAGTGGKSLTRCGLPLQVSGCRGPFA